MEELARLAPERPAWDDIVQAPLAEDHAARMLNELSGRTHAVDGMDQAGWSLDVADFLARRLLLHGGELG